MKLEITYDPKEVAQMEGLRLDPLWHEVLAEGEWLKCAKRTTGRDTLLIYRHRGTGRFILADLIYPPDVIQELESWEDTPDRLGIPMEWMKMRCEPQDEILKRIMNNMKETNYARRATEASDSEQRDDALKWLKRQGHEDLARNLAMQPYTGEAGGGESLEATREKLNTLAKLH